MVRRLLAQSSSETAKHSADVAVITGAICDLLRLTGPARDEIIAGAKLHDIGKSAVSRAILDKPGRLTDAEWMAIRSHTVVGYEILVAMPELEGVARLVRHSHERWDGGGYPDGLTGEEIPIGSRIIFCADAYDAIRSDRSYRKGRPAKDALAEVRRGAGTQFDPRVTEALAEVVQELRGAGKAPPRRVVRSSRRLMALMLVLTAGLGGTAAAGGLFGDVFGGGEGASSSDAPLPCVIGDCPSPAGATQGRSGGRKATSAGNGREGPEGSGNAGSSAVAGGSSDGAPGAGVENVVDGLNNAVNGASGAVNQLPGTAQDTVGGVTDTAGRAKDKVGGLLGGN